MADRMTDIGMNQALDYGQAQNSLASVRIAKKHPQFDPGLTVLSRALVVDQHGEPWWIDPDNKTIEPANA